MSAWGVGESWARPRGARAGSCGAGAGLARALGPAAVPSAGILPSPAPVNPRRRWVRPRRWDHLGALPWGRNGPNRPVGAGTGDSAAWCSPSRKSGRPDSSGHHPHLAGRRTSDPGGSRPKRRASLPWSIQRIPRPDVAPRRRLLSVILEQVSFRDVPFRMTSGRVASRRLVSGSRPPIGAGSTANHEPSGSKRAAFFSKGEDLGRRIVWKCAAE